MDEAYLKNWRVVAYGFVAFAIILASCLVVLALAPSDIERCATSCGQGQFKSWTDSTPGHSSDDGVRPPIPQKCECK
jgi:hypothetical protein